MTMSIGIITQRARKELASLTGLELSSTLKTTRENRGWRVMVELVEQHVVPNSMDILVAYEAILDDEGTLIEFSRKGMRRRMEPVMED